MHSPLKQSDAPKAEVKKLGSLLYYLRPYRTRVALTAVAILFTSLAVLGLGSALRYMVDKGLGERNMALFNHSYLLLMGVILLLAGASYARYFLVSWLGERVVADIRGDIYRRLLHMDIGFFESMRTGDLLSRLTTDTTLLQTLIGTTVSVALRNLLLLVGGIVLLLVTSTALTGYVAVMMPVVIAPILLLGRRVRALSRETQAQIAALNAQGEQAIGAIRTLQAMTLEEEEMRGFTRQAEAVLNAALSRIRLRSFLIALVILLIFGAVVTVLWIGGHQVVNGQITAGVLSSFVFYAVVVASATGALSDVVSDLQRAAGAAERVNELLALTPAIQSPEHPVPLPELRSAGILFREVGFSYPVRTSFAALDGITLEVQPGEIVAVVGPSGAGKTTLFQLLLRFYDPQEGGILLGDTDLRHLDLRDLRGAIGLVPQDPAIFADTALANIRAGRPGASDGEVHEAARAAHALEFLERLPEGLNTYLGERGVRLSGGQKQRIAIARAIIRNPAILLLDEATSALDAESEHFVQQALSMLMKGRTTLVIAHRLSTVMNADRIVLMHEGRIEAIGTHAELQRKSPLYSRLATLQFGQNALRY